MVLDRLTEDVVLALAALLKAIEQGDTLDQVQGSEEYLEAKRALERWEARK